MTPPSTEVRAARARRRALTAQLRGLRDCLVAYSGGVDSSVLLHAATAVLGERAAGFVADSPSLPRAELEEARAFAAHIGARLFVRPTAELADPRYRANAPDRCYFCKHTLFSDMVALARREGFTTLAFGEITDDLGDVRPGALAAAELGVVAPLRSAGFSKSDVRAYARARGWSVADKPASACLASRIPHGTPVTPERLSRIERSEAAVRTLGLRQVRVRDHGSHARLEAGPDELSRARELGDAVGRVLRDEGFVSWELREYRRGGRG